jgi:tetratricopeptide (TPR) repeat protein
MALEEYESAAAPVDDQLRALAGMLMVAMRWVGSVGDRPSEEWLSDLRGKGRELLSRAADPYSIGRFLAADSFFPFWIQGNRAATPDELAEANSDANRAIAIAHVLNNLELESIALDALAGTAQAVADWDRARETANERIRFEDKLGLYERLDAHSMVAWMSYLMGDFATGDRDSAEMVSRLLPGQAPYPALHLYAWRAIILFTLGRWDEATSMFWRCIDAWRDAGSHAAGYGLRGFNVGIDIGRARGDQRLLNAASATIESILSRYPARHAHRDWAAQASGDVRFEADFEFPQTRGFNYEQAERQLSVVCDLRRPVPQQVREGGLERAQNDRTPLLEGQLWRARALNDNDAEQMLRAVEIFERLGAVPQLGRARAERGLLRHDAAEIDAGLAILKKLGDNNYVDRFAADAV